jgi:glutamine amidotransferase
METVVIVDCGSGNLRSAAKAFEYAAADAGREIRVEVTNDPAAVHRADRIALPGQGAFAAVLSGVADVPGLREALEYVAIDKARPFLGICVGMQLMASRGLEHGAYKGFGWIPGEVVPLDPTEAALKVPHMGWNDLKLDQPSHPVLGRVSTGDHAYFVHSYRFACADDSHCLAETNYGVAVAAIIGRDNLIGTQFHPEKSQAVGLALIGSFLDWRP